MLRMPAVVVGDQCERGVADLGFPCQLCLWQVVHPYDIHSPLAVELRFSKSRERRALHAQICAAPVNPCSHSLAGLFEHVAEDLTYRMRKRYVSYNPIT